MSTKLLVIDDDPGITEMLSLVLRPEGYDVSVAHSGPEGIELTRQSPPDIIILDLMMPEVDGWHVCRTIRTFSEVPILVLSAVVDSTQVKRALDEGADDYLAKPAPLSLLISRLRDLVPSA